MICCTRCGSENDIGGKFCKNCGNELTPIHNPNTIKSMMPLNTKVKVISVIAIVIVFSLIFWAIIHTIVPHNKIDKSDTPEGVVYSYLESINKQDWLLFHDSVSPTTELAALRSYAALSQFSTSFGSGEHYEISFENQMIEAKKLFQANYGSNWLEKIDITTVGQVDTNRVNVMINIEGNNTTLQTVHNDVNANSNNKWQLETDDYTVLLPEIKTLLKNVLLNDEKTSVVSNYMDLLSKGIVNGIEFGIGCNIKDIKEKWRNPDAESYFMGAPFARYDSEMVTFHYDEVTGKVTSITLFGNANVYGIQIGDSFDSIAKVLGNTITEAIPDREINEWADTKDFFSCAYTSGDYMLVFYLDNEQKSTKAFVNRILSYESVTEDTSGNGVSSEGTTSSKQAEPNTYTVKPGDSMMKISKKVYGDPSMYKLIMEANDIDDMNSIKVGQVLKIPALDQ